MSYNPANTPHQAPRVGGAAEKTVPETNTPSRQSATALAEPPVATSPSAGSMIVYDAVTKVYEPDVLALNDVTFHIDKGEFVFVVGASGSGKSTLVRLLLKELDATDGKIVVGGRDLSRLKRSKVAMLRRNIGCVFQDFKLLPNRNVYQNVAYALQVQGKSRAEIRRKVPDIIGLVGLADMPGPP